MTRVKLEQGQGGLLQRSLRRDFAREETLSLAEDEDLRV